MPLQLIEQRAQLPLTACTTDGGSQAPLKWSTALLISEVPLGIACFSLLMIYSPQNSLLCIYLDSDSPPSSVSNESEFKQTLCPENTNFLKFWSSRSRKWTYFVNNTWTSWLDWTIEESMNVRWQMSLLLLRMPLSHLVNFPAPATITVSSLRSRFGNQNKDLYKPGEIKNQEEKAHKSI